MDGQSVSFRAKRSCSFCGMTVANRRLLKMGTDNRVVCVDVTRCANRRAMNRDDED